ncbi:succinylglutamate desuccinylase/aspartoacylase family protein [Patescibacteria group bacterium]|nr:succinylglutamate desuccinylase/aspartoacylase family protein [Patescibacteria group bacterium]MBU1754721.1 succinylglutamate desuccinylase/aspartoacylase family protein [Patescibacteria group bacterium]
MQYKKEILVGAGVLVVLTACVAGYFLVTQKNIEEVPIVPIAEEAVLSEVVGTSVQGRDITAYHYGTGDTNLLFVGGIHGGYEWNSVLLAYRFMDYLEANPDAIPDSLRITIVPSANPDGIYKVIQKEGRFGAIDVPNTDQSIGRFNANGVDLNRNFACKWKSTSMWRGKTVSAGTGAFSEPEAVAIRTVVEDTNPIAVVFWHSQSNAVYASECENGILPATRTLMTTYASAAGYPAVDTFDAYEITGDAEGWLASIGIPAITVELKTHESIEWERNLRALQALFAQYK